MRSKYATSVLCSPTSDLVLVAPIISCNFILRRSDSTARVGAVESSAVTVDLAAQYLRPPQRGGHHGHQRGPDPPDEVN